jgi:hypothetical protein
MSITSHRKLFVAAIAAATFATAAPAHASYGWPVKPFHRQHAVRGYFGDPRIAGRDEALGTFHFGIDVVAPNGTPVYSPRDGIAGRNRLHPDVVIVSQGGGNGLEFWHVIPAVRPGNRVQAYRTVLGYVEKPWQHVHFSETVGGVYVNPLRPGALEPYRDPTKPAVHGIYFERDGHPAGSRVSGTIDIVAEALDTTPLPIAAPWNDKPVTPALVEWRLVGGRSLVSSIWHVAADFEGALPTVPFTSVYARWTRQNHPWKRGGTARYRFYLARGLDTHTLANGTYRVVVRVVDTRGNSADASRTLTVANGV